MTAKQLTSRLGLLAAVAAIGLCATAATAAAAPAWSLNSSSNTTVAPGENLEYIVTVANVGEDLGFGTTKLHVTLPPGLTGVAVRQGFPPAFSCPGVSGATEFTCEGKFEPKPHGAAPRAVGVVAAVDASASGVRTAHFTIESDGVAVPVSTVDPVRVDLVPPDFGIDAFDTAALSASGSVLSAAGVHPGTYLNQIDFNTRTDPSPIGDKLSPLEDPRDIAVELPPGFLGNASALPECSLADLTATATAGFDRPFPLCAPESQVGTVTLRLTSARAPIFGTTFVGPNLAFEPIYNMVPPPGVPARFGFLFANSVVAIDAAVRTSGDYGITASVTNASQGLALSGSSLEFWGVPSDPIHTHARACVGDPLFSGSGNTCASKAPPQPFFRNPTSCTPPLPTTLRIDSWQHPGVFRETTIHSHETPGYPYAPEDWGREVGIEGCAEVPFDPSLSAQVTADLADGPAGLTIDLGVPQDCWKPKATVAGAETSTCQSDLRDAEVTLPQGMTLNPSSASGLGACSPAQVGLLTPVGQASPIHFDESAAGCPDNSKIGNVEIATPLLDTPLKGAVYLAQQGQNPFGSLLSMYLVAEGSGVVVKQAGEIVSDPSTGRLTTRFTEAPQLPFSNLHVALFDGQRAALRTPPTCGTFAVQAKLTPWSGNPAVSRAGSFEVEQCGTHGFDPKLSAGTQNPLAGDTSPFSLRVTREDGEQDLGGLTAQLPPGLSGYLKGIPYCSDAALAGVSGDLGTGVGQEQSPSCPAASQVGTVTVGAGAGSNPFYTQSGRAYLAGPYKGAPLSLAVVAPAVAGPFDLGSVVVRNAIRVDPESAALTVQSDPLPTILHGIPLDLRDVRVQVNRDHFTLNPTSCEPFSIGSQIVSAAGAVATPSEHFQAAGCDQLGFKPRLSLRLQGGTRRSKHPALTAVMRPRLGDANAARIQVALPHSEFLAQNHIRTICTRVQFAADACPAGSVYGSVTATTPILDYPLTGNAYLRSSDHPLPDLVLKLEGPPSQPIEIDAVGRIDSKRGGIRTTFEGLPDAPLTKVVLRMQGGKKSLLENSTNLCRGRHEAAVLMAGQNGKLRTFSSELRAQCPGERGHGKRGRR